VEKSHRNANFHSVNGKIATACVRDQLGLVSDVLSTCCDAGVQACAMLISHESGVGVCMQSDVSMQSNVSSSCVDVQRPNIHNSVMNDAKIVDSFLSDGWSELRYLDISIDGILNVIRGLDDLCAHFCLIQADVIACMNLPRIGKVILRDFL